jgi:chromate transport protein ChrA
VRRFTRSLTATSVGLIFAATASIGRATLTTVPAGIVCVVAFALVYVLKWNPIVSLAVAALAGLTLHLAG